MTPLNRASFLATFPPIQSAIKIYGDESGMRVQLEIPQSEMGEAVKMLAMTGKVLKVTVEVWTELDDGTKEEPESGGARMDRRRLKD